MGDRPMHIAIDLGTKDMTGLAVRCLKCGYINSGAIEHPCTQAELKVLAIRLWADHECKESP